MRFDGPMLVTTAEAGFQLGLTDPSDVEALIHRGEIVALTVRGQRLVVMESVTSYVKRETKRVLAGK